MCDSKSDHLVDEYQLLVDKLSVPADKREEMMVSFRALAPRKRFRRLSVLQGQLDDAATSAFMSDIAPKGVLGEGNDGC
jgi:hypothetical protein